jgi:hypothetical protein
MFFMKCSLAQMGFSIQMEHGWQAVAMVWQMRQKGIARPAASGFATLAGIIPERKSEAVAYAHFRTR